jgi:hypothetical protein
MSLGQWNACCHHCSPWRSISRLDPDSDRGMRGCCPPRSASPHATRPRESGRPSADRPTPPRRKALTRRRQAVRPTDSQNSPRRSHRRRCGRSPYGNRFHSGGRTTATSSRSALITAIGHEPSVPRWSRRSNSEFNLAQNEHARLEMRCLRHPSRPVPEEGRGQL